MFQLIFALFMAFACPAHNNNNNNHSNNGNGTVTTQDTGGDGEHIPPKKPKPNQP